MEASRSQIECYRYLSAVIAFEPTNKVRIGKMEEASKITERFLEFMQAGRFTALLIEVGHAHLAWKIVRRAARHVRSPARRAGEHRARAGADERRCVPAAARRDGVLMPPSCGYAEMGSSSKTRASREAAAMSPRSSAV